MKVQFFVLIILVMNYWISAYGEPVKRSGPPPCFKNNAEMTALSQKAQKGDVRAQLALGEEYRLGSCVPQNYETSLYWINKAALQGLPDAQRVLGSFYLNGWGVSKNEHKAIELYRKAAEEGLSQAQYDLGGFYLNGSYGLSKDAQQAIVWYQKAADQGMIQAIKDLASIYKLGINVPVNFKEATKWLRKAVDRGDGIAMTELADILLSGKEGVAQNENEAAVLYRMAADQGLVHAQYSLGRLYEEGRGVTRDFKTAYMWYTISEPWWHDFNQRKKSLICQTHPSRN